MLAKPRRMGALILLLLLGLQMGAPSPAGAKTYAYLVDLERNVVKLDTDTDTIVGRAMLTNLPAFIGEDHQVVGAASDNLFFDVYGVGAFRVAVFDLRALTFRRDLGIASSTTPRILVPPTQGQFFVEWFDPTASPGQGSRVVSRFDKASLARLGDIAPPPSLDNRNAFSRDGARLYSYQSDEQRVLRTFETGQLQLVSTLDIPPLFAPGLWGKSVRDIQGDRMLLSENTKTRRTDPNRISLFTMSLTDGTRSPKISTGLQADSQLTPAGDKIVLSETTTILAPDGSIDQIQSLGRLHLYDVAAGAKLGQVTFPVRGNGRVVGIRPQGDKLYFASGTFGVKTGTLASVSLVTQSLLKEITVPPSGSWSSSRKDPEGRNFRESRAENCR